VRSGTLRALAEAIPVPLGKGGTSACASNESYGGIVYLLYSSNPPMLRQATVNYVK
jgi:hypothetical protein